MLSRALLVLASAVGLATVGTACAAAEPPSLRSPPAISPSPPPPSAAAPAIAARAPGAPPSRPAGPARSTRPDCSDIEGSGVGPKDLPEHVATELYPVTVARHECSDWVKFRVNGTVDVGAQAEYVRTAQAARSGEPIAMAGGAILQVVVYAPDFAHANPGHQPGRTPWRIGAHVATVPGGWPSLRQVMYAGVNDGSEAVFAVRVRERLPFTIFRSARPDYTEVVIEIAHGGRL